MKTYQTKEEAERAREGKLAELTVEHERLLSEHDGARGYARRSAAADVVAVERQILLLAG